MKDTFPPEDSLAIGHQAAQIAADALEELGRTMIQQKALDVARQIEIYLSHSAFSSLEDIRHDVVLASIAVTKIGRSGFTAVHDTNATNIFHHNPDIRGKDLREVAQQLSGFLDIVESGLTRESDGYYDWLESDGLVHRKYMYCVPLFPQQIAPLGLVVAATISIDEFLQPSREISQRIITLAERVDEYHRLELRRNERLAATNRLSRKISSYLEAEVLLPSVVTTIAEAFRIQSVRIFMLVGPSGQLGLAAQAGELPCLSNADGDGILNPCLAETVAITGKPYVSKKYPPETDAAPSAGEQDACEPARLIVPIRIGRTILGVLDLMDVRAKPFGDIDLYTIWPLADQIGTALENARLHNELREVAVVEERNRIAREIHDTLAQGFAGISMLTESAKLALNDKDLQQAAAQMDRIRGLAKEKLSEARRSVQALRPDITIQEDLETLIQEELAQLARDMTIASHFDVVGETQPVPQAIKLALVRICQETLHNIQKHASAQNVHVAMTYNPNAVAVVIEDDGIGFDPRTPTPDHFGLTVMRERARLVGGSVIVNSQVGVGTKVYVNMPR